MLWTVIKKITNNRNKTKCDVPVKAAVFTKERNPALFAGFLSFVFRGIVKGAAEDVPSTCQKGFVDSPC
jgi:hypothetical protein